MKQLNFSVMRMMPFIFVSSIVFTTIMALIPIADVPNPFNLWDKAQHALAFILLTLTGSLAYNRNTKAVYVGLILYGAGIEILQSTLTTTRFGEVSDLIADVVGVTVGFIIYSVANKILRHQTAE